MATAAAALALVLAPGTFALALLLALPRLRHPLPPGTLWMTIGTLLWMLPLLLRGAPATLLDNLQPVALILIVAVVSTLPLSRSLSPIALGVLIGLTLLGLFTLLQLGGAVSALLAPFVDNDAIARLAENSRAAQALGRASGWMEHPNQWAVRGLVPGTFVLAAAGGPRWRVTVVLPTVLIALAAGSRATLLGLALGLLLLALHYLWRGRFSVRKLALVSLSLAAMAALALLPPWGARVQALFDLIAPDSTPVDESYNLFIASADLNDASWFERGVTVEQLRDGEQTAWTVRKTLEGSGQRLQQRIELAPGDYILSAELRALDPAARPGLLAFWRDASMVEHALNVQRRDGDWHTNTQGSLSLLSFEQKPLEDGWLRLELSFRNDAEDIIVFPVGPTPDRRRVAGGQLDVRNLQLVEGTTALPYQPTFPPDRARLQAQSSALGRGPIFAAAWQGFLARPLLGHAEGAFSAWFQRWNDNDAVVVGHAHNLFLQTLFARGIVGSLGLVLLLTGMALATGGAPGFLIVLAAVLAANLFDATFWTAGQSYLLAAAAGWYAARRPRPHTAAAPPSG